MEFADRNKRPTVAVPPRRLGLRPRSLPTAKPKPHKDSRGRSSFESANVAGRAKPALPSLPKPSLTKLTDRIGARKESNRSSKKLVLVSIAACILLAAYGGYLFASHKSAIPSVSWIPGSKAKPAFTSTKIHETPTYPTVEPQGKTVQSLGGWQRVSPPDRNPVFAYADRINNVAINVSEQPLPDSFKAETGEAIKNLAKSYSAEEKVTIGDTVAYVGTSGKGPQSVIFTKNNLLILIKSTGKIDSDHWAQYINALQ